MEQAQTKSNVSPRLRDKLKSRKFWLSQQVIWLSIGVPILFQKLEIGEAVTLMVLGVVGGAGAAYGVVNTLEKKWNL